MRNTFYRSEIFRKALQIVRKLQNSGFRAFFVGGAVRDLLLGQSPKDIDIVTSALPEDVINLFPHCQEVGVCFGVILVEIDKKSFEVATFREERNYLDGRHPESVKYTDKPEIDAERRDFTINGMFFDPIKEELIDYVGGKSDLERGIIRAIRNPEERFAEDYLRILRAIRFGVRLDFMIDKKTAAAIRKFTPKIKSLSMERIQEELNKMLTGKRPAVALEMLADFGIIKEILPEIEVMKGLTQPEKFHPEGDVFTHTKLMLTRMCCPSVELAWAILLHDVGKAVTLSVDENGIEHFYKHAQEGVELTKKILKRLRFANKTIGTVAFAVENHMRFAHVSEMKESKLKKMLAEPTFPLELELHRIDCLCSNNRLGNYVFLLDKINEVDSKVDLPPPLLNGRDLLDLGIEEGPHIGEILGKVTDLQLEGEISTRDEALKLVRSWI